MLTEILHRAQAFERRHGRRPNTLFLTHEQYSLLRNEYPEILGESPEIVLGLRIAMTPNKSLLQPKISWLPARVPNYLRQRKIKCQQAEVTRATADENSDLFDVLTRSQAQQQG